MSSQTAQSATASKKKLVGVVVVSMFAALATQVLVMAAGLASEVPETELKSVGVVLPPALTVMIPAFIVAAFFGILYVFFGDRLDEKFAETRRQFAQLPPAGHAVAAGFPFAFVGYVAVALTDLYATDLPVLGRLLVGAVVWIAVSAATYQQLQEGKELDGFVRTMTTGAVAGSILALVLAGVDAYFLGSTLPGYLPLAVLLVVSPAVTFAIVRQIEQEDEDGPLTTMLVESGFAQLGQLQTLTVAGGFGFLAAVIVGMVATLAGWSIAYTGLSFVLALLVGTGVPYLMFQRAVDEREDLVITGVRERSVSDRRELSVRNDGDGEVDLRDAKIRDTDGDVFRTNIDLVLGSSRSGTFDIPAEFSLYPSGEETKTELPFDISIKKTVEAPVVVTRTGQTFALQFAPGVEAPEDHEIPEELRKEKKESPAQRFDDGIESATGGRVDPDDEIEDRTGANVDDKM